MILRDAKFYDLIANGLGNVTYQEFVDTFLADTQNGLDVEGFSWSPDLSLDFTYSQVQATLGLKTMATYVDLDSPGVYKSKEGITLQTGDIPRMKHGYAFNEKVLRQQMAIFAETGYFSDNFKSRMQEVLFDNTNDLLEGIHNSLSYQRHQMVSAGKFELTASNNPDGIKAVTFSANIPAENQKKLTGTSRWFTDNAGTVGTASKPIDDLRDMQDKMEDKGVMNYHWEVDKRTLKSCLNHPSIKSAIGAYIFPNSGQTDITGSVSVLGIDRQIQALEAILGCSIMPIDKIVAVDKFDKTVGKIVKSQIRAFNANVWALVPDGSLGNIQSVRPIPVGVENARVALSDGGRTFLCQWFDPKVRMQYIEAEHTSLVVPDKPQYMFRLEIA